MWPDMLRNIFPDFPSGEDNHLVLIYKALALAKWPDMLRNPFFFRSISSHWPGMIRKMMRKSSFSPFLAGYPPEWQPLQATVGHLVKIKKIQNMAGDDPDYPRR